jgi:mitochondrial fission protein ELM1
VILATQCESDNNKYDLILISICERYTETTQFAIIRLMNKSPTCWILTPGPVAFRKQTAGVAQALGLTYEEKVVKRNKPWCWLPKNWTFGALRQLQPGCEKLSPPWPDVVISCSQYTIPYALAIRKANGGNTSLIHIQKPTIANSYFDAVIAPEHDNASGANVLQTLGATHDVDENTLNNAVEEFTPRFKPFKAPYCSIFLGGSSKQYDFTHEHAAVIANSILDIAKNYPGTLLISGSRRTGADNMTYFERRFKDYPNIFLYNNVGKNPYMGMLALADVIYVTDDSVSMISEACYTGKPVYLLRLPQQQQRRKIGEFIDTAIKRGHVRYYEDHLEGWLGKRLDETQRVAPALKELLKDKITL